MPRPPLLRRNRLRSRDAALDAVVEVAKSLPEGQEIDAARLVAAATQTISADFAEFGEIPQTVYDAMVAQGLDSQPPFSPGAPLRPYRSGDQPRNYDYKVGRNIAVQPRTGLTSFQTLRSIVDSYDVARICIKHLTNDVRSLDLMFQPMAGVTEDVSDEIAQARAFFRKPDGQHTFRGWLAMYLDDVLRYDAGTLYKRRDRLGRLIALEVVSGTTIMPQTDYYGRTPTGDAPAYAQVVSGTPWVWMKSTDLIYEPLNPSPDSVYGTAPIELVLLRANTDLRFQWYLLQRFTEGNLPAAFGEVPEDMNTPAAITEMQEAWDALMLGEQDRKRQIRWVPHGSKVTPFREEGFDKEMALYLFRLTCAAYGVTPNDLGITDDVNRASGETQVDVQFRVGTEPITMHLQDIFDEILQTELGLRVQARFDTGREKDDRLAEAQAHKLYVEMGAEGVDEVRSEVLGLDVEAGEATPRFVMTASGPVPLASIASTAGKIDPLTAAPEAGTVDDSAPVDDAIVPIEGSEVGSGVPVTKTLDDGSSLVDALLPPTPAPVAAGLVVVAADTGRLLLLQRGLGDPEDPAAGCWEFPGGCLEADEIPLAAAWREWAEEVGQPVPYGRPAGAWVSPNGIYAAFVWVIESESLVAVNADPENRRVINPDDPDHDEIETVAWMPLAHLPEFPGLRPEAAESTDWDLLARVVGDLGLTAKELTAGITAETGIVGVDLVGSPTLEDTLTPEIRSLLSKWRANSRTRVSKALPPRRFDGLPVAVADAVWPLLEPARTRADVDAAFDAVKARRPKARAGGQSKTL